MVTGRTLHLTSNTVPAARAQNLEDNNEGDDTVTFISFQTGRRQKNVNLTEETELWLSLKRRRPSFGCPSSVDIPRSIYLNPKLL
jgi:hypothetical protein